MPDSRTHRGPHPKDREQFAVRHHPALRSAAEELSWLLSRGYKTPSALKLVGDRYGLTVRQRDAVSRAACSDLALDQRKEKCVDFGSIRELWVDGFNVLMSLEVALSGGLLLRARDHCVRDLASVHGTYRSVEETDEAIDLLLAALAGGSLERIVLMLDSPVSNSGRLAQKIRRRAPRGMGLEVMLGPAVDFALIHSARPVATADSAILDRAEQWVNLAWAIISTQVPDAWVVDLAPSGRA